MSNLNLPKEKEYHAVVFTGFYIQRTGTQVGQRLRDIHFTATDVVKLGVREEDELNDLFDIILD